MSDIIIIIILPPSCCLCLMSLSLTLYLCISSFLFHLILSTPSPIFNPPLTSFSQTTSLFAPFSLLLSLSLFASVPFLPHLILLFHFLSLLWMVFFPSPHPFSITLFNLFLTHSWWSFLPMPLQRLLKSNPCHGLSLVSFGWWHLPFVSSYFILSHFQLSTSSVFPFLLCFFT